MPKKYVRNKRTGPRNVKPRSVAELLQRGASGAAPRVESRERHDRELSHNAEAGWRGWFAARLPTPLASRLGDIVSKPGSLTLFTESAAWSARLRVAVAELQEEAGARDPRLRRIDVRVMPTGGSAKR